MAITPDYQKIALELLTIGVCVVSPDGNVLQCNSLAGRLLNAPDTGLLSKNILDFLPESTSLQLKSILANTSEEKSRVSHILDFLLDPKGVPKEMRLHATYAEDGKCYVLTFENSKTAFFPEALVPESHTFGDVTIVAHDEPMRRLLASLPSIAATEAPVLVTGESGTGKELIARAVHHLSERSEQPFVAINCGAFPDALIESELFGFLKGAFTDAHRDKKGCFELAAGGTLFLDEVGELPQPMQVKLLRVLQEQEFRPIGSETPIRTDVRVITATNRNLAKMTKEKTFRLDLYYRIRVVELELPPLRERKETIPHLISHFIKKFSKVYDKQVRSMSAPALKKLLEYSYPGNVRELSNVVERAFAICPFDEIQSKCLPSEITVSGREAAPPEPATENGNPQPEKDVITEVRALEAEEIERELIRQGGSRKKTAQALGISTATLWRKMKKYGLN